MKKILKAVLMASLLIIFVTPVSAYTFGIKSNVSKVAPGAKFKVNFNFSGEGLFKISVTNGKTSVSEVWYPDPESQNIVITAGNSGSVTVTVTSLDATSSDFEHFGGKDKSISKSVTVNIVKPSTPTPKPPTLDNTEDDKKKPPVKTPEEIAKDKLEERRNTPLISGISISSDSERLNGEVLKELPVQKGLYNYRYVLPRSIDAIILDVKGSFDDVELVYDKNIKLEDESLAVKIIAKQDVITQEYVLTLERPVEISTAFRFDNDSYRVIEDDYLSVQMRDLGFTKSSFDVEDATKGSFFNLDSNTVVLAVNENNDAKWLLLDDNLEVDKEVVIVGEEKGSLLVPEVDEAVDKKLQGTNSYETIDVNIPVKIKEVDTSLKFKETVGGWSYDDTGAITHALNSEGEIEVVHLGSDGEVKQAYVIFDQSSGFSFDLLTYGLIGLWFFTILVFSIDRKRTNRKINTLISRRNAYNNEG